ncbi:MAG TPA: hypothetical protein V6C72_14580, partial [Chroococcales cyanobacterium]
LAKEQKESVDFRRVQSVNLAVGHAASRLKASDLLVLRTWCAKVTLALDLAREEKLGSNTQLAAARQWAEKVTGWKPEKVLGDSGVVAKLMFDLAERFLEAGKDQLDRRTARQLIDAALLFIRNNDLPTSLKQRVEEIRGKREPAIAAPPESSYEREVQRRFHHAMNRLLAGKYRKHDLHFHFRPFKADVAAGIVPDLEMVTEFAYQMALAYKQLGDWFAQWYDAGSPQAALLAKRQECRGYIPFCETAFDAYETASRLLRWLIAQAKDDKRYDSEAKYRSALAPVLARLDRKHDLVQNTDTLRLLIQQGARLIHTTISDVCNDFIRTQKYGSAEEFIHNQLRALHDHDERERIEKCEALLWLARTYAADKRVELAKHAYQGLIEFAKSRQYEQLQFQIEFAQFMVREDRLNSKEQVSKAALLALHLGLIESAEADDWQASLIGRAVDNQP